MNFVNKRDTVLTHNDFFAGMTAAFPVTEKWQTFAEMKLPRIRAYALGHGVYGGQQSATGRFFGMFKNASSEIQDFEIRIKVRDEHDNMLRTTLFEGNALELSFAKSEDRTTWKVFAQREVEAMISPEYTIEIQVRSVRSGVVIDPTKCIMLMSCVTWDVKY